jgi:hypothetical protein
MSTTLRIGQGIGRGIGQRISRRLGLRTARDGADPRALHDELLLMLVFVGLLMLVVALSLAGAGTIARPLYMVSAVLICATAKRRSPWLYLSATLWFWLFTAFVRRIIEWRSGFIATDIILATPNLLVLMVVPDIFRTRGLLTRPGIGYPMLLTACVLYGLFVSFVRGDVLAGAIGAAEWVTPLLYLFLFVCNAERIQEAEAHFGLFMTGCLLLFIPYSLYQYFYLPDWDAYWVVSAGMGSLGHPLPMDTRVFGPTNGPLVLAIWTSTCLTLLSYFRNRLLLLMAPFLFLLIAITGVRAVYGSLMLAIVVGALIGRGGFGRLLSIIAVAGVTGYVALATLNPIVTDQIAKRLDSMQNLSEDNSAQTRQEIYAETPAVIAGAPFGEGIGAQGRGQAASGGNTINIDSGPLSVFLALGWFAAPLYLLAVLALQCKALMIGRRRNSPIASTMAAAALCPLGVFPFINGLIGFNGVMLWTCLGFALAVEIHATTRTPAVTHATADPNGRVRRPVLAPARRPPR